VTDSLSTPRQPVDPTSAESEKLGANYWRAWTAASLSSVADGVLSVALPLVAISTTRSPTLVAGLAFALNLPWLLFALPAGALVDRLDRRRALLVANSMRALLAAVLVFGAVYRLPSIWLLIAVAFGIGVAQTIYDTASQSILPQLVGRNLLAKANGRLYAAELTGAEFAGPPLAGMLVGLSVVVAFATPLGLWLLAIAALLLVRGSFGNVRERQSTLRADIAEGLRFLWRQRVLRTFTMIVGVFNFATYAASAIFVLYAVGPDSAIKLSGLGFGLLLATVPVGSLIGALIARRVAQVLGRGRSLTLCFIAAALLIGIPALTTNPYVIGVVFVIGGLAIMVSNIIMVTLRQQVTPDRLLGRVSSSHRLVAYGTQSLGAATGGALAHIFGLRQVFLLMGLLALTVLAGRVIVTDEAMDTAVRKAVES
jgi:MFS family permease